VDRCAGGLKDRPHRGWSGRVRRSINATEPCEAEAVPPMVRVSPLPWWRTGQGRVCLRLRGLPLVGRTARRDHRHRIGASVPPIGGRR